ncbi:MAG: 50S ribosomal protein L10 [Nanoarchaeota archaeon]
MKSEKLAGKKTIQVSEKKKTLISELLDLIKKKKTILIASIKNIPSSQYQEISKKLRGKAIVKVPKKSMIFRALDNSGIEEIKKLKSHVKDSTAILFSDMESFELAAELVSKRSPARAKQGQEAPSDIEIPEGPTDLIPGPAISELGALGIKIQIEKGKIIIKEPKVIVKEGEKISQAAAEVMNKLGIKPFSIGFIPLAAFDAEERKLYLEIKIDREGTLKELKDSFSRALGFAVGISYISHDTIKFLIQKAVMQDRALENLAKENVANTIENNINSEVSELKVNETNS